MSKPTVIGINFEILKKEIKTFTISEEDSYLNSYREFINYFQDIPKIEKHHLIISSHFVYGWMPTILNLSLIRVEKVLEILNKAKKDEILNTSELEILKKAINNSLVGTSKLLHFINPHIYPIWDSKIFKYWSGKNTIYGIQNPGNYLEFTGQIHKTVKDPEFAQIHSEIESLLNYKVNPIRALELLIFQSSSKTFLKD